MIRMMDEERILLLIFHDYEKELLKKIELRSGNRKSKLPKSLFCYHIESYTIIKHAPLIL
jgi:hypothetical protein